MRLKHTMLQDNSLDRKRGFIHLVASDPQGIQLPPRALPVYLLNGRQTPREAGEAPTLGTFGGMRRRLNMINELLVARPRVILLVSNGAEQPLNGYIELWKQEGFLLSSSTIKQCPGRYAID